MFNVREENVQCSTRGQTLTGVGEDNEEPPGPPGPPGQSHGLCPLDSLLSPPHVPLEDNWSFATHSIPAFYLRYPLHTSDKLTSPTTGNTAVTSHNSLPTNEIVFWGNRIPSWTFHFISLISYFLGQPNFIDHLYFILVSLFEICWWYNITSETPSWAWIITFTFSICG